MAELSALSDSEREVWSTFYSMRRTLDRALDLQLQRDSGISASEYEILLAINAAPGRRLRVKDIAGTIGWEKSRVSHLVARMEKRDLLSRTECQSDARGSWIGLTPAGRRAVLGAMRGHVAAIRKYFFDVLAADEADRLKNISGRVVDAIGCGADEDVPLD
ncbi:MAG TPA: MarR family winged helix-turn-helix transcriptional regulator [Lacisediminihabitans sp.]|uniref:MarR family winged helix-turn-helix transcriptional regulator n=1 Tax=Lacisediminihabitans sp. TaxID=2787631 RepID=UPI002ED7CB0D